VRVDSIAARMAERLLSQRGWTPEAIDRGDSVRLATAAIVAPTATSGTATAACRPDSTQSDGSPGSARPSAALSRTRCQRGRDHCFKTGHYLKLVFEPDTLTPDRPVASEGPVVEAQALGELIRTAFVERGALR
jgi:hypothetical protein